MSAWMPTAWFPKRQAREVWLARIAATSMEPANMQPGTSTSTGISRSRMARNIEDRGADFQVTCTSVMLPGLWSWWGEGGRGVLVDGWLTGGWVADW